MAPLEHVEELDQIGRPRKLKDQFGSPLTGGRKRCASH
jgi:hypothetical protein